MYVQLSINEMKENSANHITRSTKIQGRIPFQDITNVAASRISSNGKQGMSLIFAITESEMKFFTVKFDIIGNTFLFVDLPISGTKCTRYPPGVSIKSSTSSVGHKGMMPTNASEHKRYRARERYMGMTLEQRDAYLQRNREYKRRRKNHDGNMHKTTLASRSTGGTYRYFLKIRSYLLT
jgi:hypothetical protein